MLDDDVFVVVLSQKLPIKFFQKSNLYICLIWFLFVTQECFSTETDQRLPITLLQTPCSSFQVLFFLKEDLVIFGLVSEVLFD